MPVNRRVDDRIRINGMASRASKRWPHEARDSLDEQLRQWKWILQKLPPVRVEKITAIREALRHGSYENEHILAETVTRLSNDLGISAHCPSLDEDSRASLSEATKGT